MTTSPPLPAARPVRVALCLLAPLAASPAAAQFVEPGHTRVVMTDVTGPPVTSGDLVAGMFEPGTVRGFTCPVAWGVRTSAEAVLDELATGSLLVATPDAPAGRPASAASQALLRSLLAGGEGSGESADRLVDALAPPANRSDDAEDAARRLAQQMDGLAADAGGMDPEAPGHRAATRLAAAVRAFNALVAESSAPFLAAPPDEFLAARAALSRLVVAALENEGRAVQAEPEPGALPCAPPGRRVIRVEMEVPPLETAVEVCRMVDGLPRQVAAIVVGGADGDTVVVSAGERRPLAEAYPETTRYAGDQAWFAGEAPIEFGDRRYVRYGLPFVPRPPAFERLGEHAGVPVLAARGSGARPETIYLPARPGCVMQEYRAEEAIRRVRG